MAGFLHSHLLVSVLITPDEDHPGTSFSLSIKLGQHSFSHSFPTEIFLAHFFFSGFVDSNRSQFSNVSFPCLD